MRPREGRQPWLPEHYGKSGWPDTCRHSAAARNGNSDKNHVLTPANLLGLRDSVAQNA
jgi:hypothetical protein